MSILINKDTKVITQGITGKTGQYHTRACRDYANGKAAFVAGVNPKKAGEDFEGIPIFASVKDAKAETGANVSVIYVPPAGAAAAIWEGIEAERPRDLHHRGHSGAGYAGNQEPHARQEQQNAVARAQLPGSDHA